MSFLTKTHRIQNNTPFSTATSNVSELCITFRPRHFGQRCLMTSPVPSQCGHLHKKRKQVWHEMHITETIYTERNKDLCWTVWNMPGKICSRRFTTLPYMHEQQALSQQSNNHRSIIPQHTVPYPVPSQREQRLTASAPTPPVRNIAHHTMLAEMEWMDTTR